MPGKTETTDGMGSLQGTAGLCVTSHIPQSVIPRIGDFAFTAGFALRACRGHNGFLTRRETKQQRRSQQVEKSR
jgi:hypothetical protein